MAGQTTHSAWRRARTALAVLACVAGSTAALPAAATTLDAASFRASMARASSDALDSLAWVSVLANDRTQPRLTTERSQPVFGRRSFVWLDPLFAGEPAATDTNEFENVVLRSGNGFDYGGTVAGSGSAVLHRMLFRRVDGQPIWNPRMPWDVNGPRQPIPEPTSALAFALGLALIGSRIRRRRR